MSTELEPALDLSATAVATAAAVRAGVVVRPVVELPELDAAARLLAGIWHGDAHPPVSTELLRAMSKSGSYVAGAFDGVDLVGACVAFFAEPAERAMHSHIAGVVPSSRRRSVGVAVKLHQRAWALDRGVSTIGWTYDPLVSRNAYVNIAKLGASPVEYLPNFYGDMGDAINLGDDTDRLLVHWRLDDPEVAQVCAGRGPVPDLALLRAAGAVEVLASSADGAPHAGRARSGDVGLVAVPPDIEAMRSSDPLRARAWRAALRETLVGLLAEGWRITGFDRSGWYVVSRA